jgi:hypothetical protein
MEIAPDALLQLALQQGIVSKADFFIEFHGMFQK